MVFYVGMKLLILLFQQVVDFSKVFMPAGVSIMVKRPNGARFGGENPGILSFASPLSKEVWACVIGALVGVTIVIFIVSRYTIVYIII